MIQSSLVMYIYAINNRIEISVRNYTIGILFHNVIVPSPHCPFTILKVRTLSDDENAKKRFIIRLQIK